MSHNTGLLEATSEQGAVLEVEGWVTVWEKGTSCSPRGVWSEGLDPAKSSVGRKQKQRGRARPGPCVVILSGGPKAGKHGA